MSESEATPLDLSKITSDNNIEHYTGEDAIQITRVVYEDPDTSNAYAIVNKMVAALDIKGIEHAETYPFVKWDTKQRHTGVRVKVIL